MITQVANSKDTPYVVTYISVGRASRPAIASAQLIRRERRSAFRFFGRITLYYASLAPAGRHVYSIHGKTDPKAPAGRHVRIL